MINLDHEIKKLKKYSVVYRTKLYERIDTQSPNLHW